MVLRVFNYNDSCRLALLDLMSGSTNDSKEGNKKSRKLKIPPKGRWY